MPGSTPRRRRLSTGASSTWWYMPVAECSPTASAAMAGQGGEIDRAACVPCHGASGGGGQGGGPSLLKGQSHDAILGTASAGRNNMPAFKSIYSADELNDVTAYIQATLQKAQQPAL